MRFYKWKAQVIAPRSPWQNAYAERVIGSIRRECLDYVVVIGERHLLGILSKYVDYYNGTRTHLSLAKGRTRATERAAAEPGQCGGGARVGGLHHEYLGEPRTPIGYADTGAVFVMEPTHAGHLHHTALARRLHAPWLGCVLGQR